MSIKSKILINLPSKPGCYLFRNANNQIIYIGKAKNIKKRVAFYFNKANNDYKNFQIIKEAKKIDFIATNNEIEAFLFEAKLIKENQPKYNIRLKTGEQYAYIRFTNEEFPMLETARHINKKDKVFGPFVSAQSRKELIRLANLLFKLRTSKNKPKRVNDKYFIRISTSPWLRETTKGEYLNDVKKAALLLAGKNQELIKKLTREMNYFSRQKKYEIAKVKRDQVFALKDLSEKQRIVLRKSFDQDVINIVVAGNTAHIQLFNIYKGVVSGRKIFNINFFGGDAKDILADFIKQYYFVNELPQEIILPLKISDQKDIIKFLTKRAGRKIKLTAPLQGDKAKLLGLLKENILLNLKIGENSLFELQDELNLPTLPRMIECFDISNIGNNFLVGSMVRFIDGKPDKNNYRRFKIKTVKEQSDFDSIREIVYRRYYRLKKEGGALPDLIIVDGGKPQLSAANSALKQLGIQVPLAALAKKNEEVFILHSAQPIKLSRRSLALKLIQRLRNEAHRFAIQYHRLLRAKNLVG